MLTDKNWLVEKQERVPNLGSTRRRTHEIPDIEASAEPPSFEFEYEIDRDEIRAGPQY